MSDRPGTKHNPRGVSSLQTVLYDDIPERYRAHLASLRETMVRDYDRLSDRCGGVEIGIGTETASRRIAIAALERTVARLWIAVAITGVTAILAVILAFIR